MTLNRKDFLRLRGENPQHAGPVLCTFAADFAGLARRIHDAVAAAGEVRGMALRVNRPPR